MGAKTWMLVYAQTAVKDVLDDHPQVDFKQSEQLAANLFPKDKLELVGDGDLSYTCPPDDEIHIGCFPGVSIVAAKEFGIDYPSKLETRFLSAGGSTTVYLHAMHSVVDWFAFAQWKGGELVRSLSLSPEYGVMEDIGKRLPFEEPFWSGQHPVEVDDGENEYPFSFHPLELGEAALKEFFGYQLEGLIDPSLLEPESVPLVRYKRKRSRWKFWS